MPTWTKYTVPISTDAVASDEVDLGGGGFVEFAVQVPDPAGYAITASVGVRALGADSAGGTYHQVGYSNSPATVTSAAKYWETPVAASGIFMAEALPFLRYLKLQPTRASTGAGVTATVSTEFVVYAKTIS